MSKRPPKYPLNRVPTCQRPYKPCAVENISSRYPGWSVHMGRIRKISSSVTEISVTGPARLLIWTHRNFCKEKSGEARSRKPSQPGQPGSYEEALIQETLNSLTIFNKEIHCIAIKFRGVLFWELAGWNYCHIERLIFSGGTTMNEKKSWTIWFYFESQFL